MSDQEFGEVLTVQADREGMFETPARVAVTVENRLVAALLTLFDDGVLRGAVKPELEAQVIEDRHR